MEQIDIQFKIFTNTNKKIQIINVQYLLLNGLN